MNECTLKKLKLHKEKTSKSIMGIYMKIMNTEKEMKKM